MKFVHVFFLVIIVVFAAAAQSDSPDGSVSQDEPALFPGIYLTFENFIHNQPITPEMIVATQEPNSREFYTLLLQERKINYIIDDSPKSVSPMDIWGYCDGRSIYLNRSVFPRAFFESFDTSVDHFARIHFLGTLSLIYYIKKITNSSAGAYHNLSSSAYTTNKPMEFILDTRDGNIHKARLEDLEKLIDNDPELLNEFKKQKKDKDTKLYIYLKKFNERHPFEFQ